VGLIGRGAEGFEEVHGGVHWSIFVSVLEDVQGIC